MCRISIITALHNKGPYIAETIASVRDQTLADWEMIVVENGSTDDGPEQVEAIATQEPRIRLIRAPESVRGPGAARNLGVDQAKGEWVLFLDADDLIEPHHLELLLKAAGLQPLAGVIAGCWQEFPDDAPDRRVLHRPATFGFSHSDLLARAVALAPWVLHAAMIKRSFLGRRNYWPEHLDVNADEDTAFWFPILLDTQVAWIDSAGALYRRLDGCSRSAIGDPLSRSRGYLEIVKHNLSAAESRNIELCPNCYGVISMMFETNYRLALTRGDKMAADYALSNAIENLCRCPADSWNLRIRRWFGIPAVNRLRRFLGRS